MKSFSEILEQIKSGPADLAGIEIASYGTPVVHMRKSGDEVQVVGADILPPAGTAVEEPPAPLELSGKLKGRYASVCVPGSGAIVKLLSFPGQFGESSEHKLLDSLRLENPDKYRIAYKLIARGHGKSESRVLTVALPEEEASIVTPLLPAGLPAPFSLEVSGLAVMTAFLNATASNQKDQAVGMAHFGSRVSSFALFNKGSLSLIRRFDLGTETILGRVQEGLGVDKETAEGIMSDGSFDISQLVNEVLTPVIKQMVVSRDFLERRENCQLAKIYVSGALTVSRDSIEEISSAMGVETGGWNPFEGLSVSSGALPEAAKGKEWQYAAAIGAGLGTFEET
ncbi:MAG: pilus assembly protein PilM [Kiritimatiellia bacterium]